MAKAATMPCRRLDTARGLAKMSAMVEKDTHIVARLAGIPKAGCRDVDHAN
ncbi:hypothetical protein [Microvirga sp. M2]|uniref:hypothetical protein n=1 Tax=Microvirga sp. M2 TaxID=3073270 RepID=UPI0039C18102